MPGTSPRALLVLVLATLVSFVGLLDAVVGGTWDFAVVFGLASASKASCSSAR